VFPQLLRRIRDKFYLGLSLEYQRITRFEYRKGGVFDQENVNSHYTGNVAGAGVILSRDKRNHAFCSTAGSLFELTATRFNSRLGSNFQYTNLLIDARTYLTLCQGHVLALQAYGNFNAGNIPFLSLASLGGSTIMRGYYSGRYRDHNLVAAQAEYRLPLWWRFGVVGFAGVGQVTRYVRHFRMGEFKAAAGGGIRFALNEKERLNLRFDYGVARHSSGSYLTVSEAF
jgi:outer membrane protein assembly factor BamA